MRGITSLIEWRKQHLANMEFILSFKWMPIQDSDSEFMAPILVRINFRLHSTTNTELYEDVSRVETPEWLGRRTHGNRAIAIIFLKAALWHWDGHVDTLSIPQSDVVPSAIYLARAAWKVGSKSNWLRTIFRDREFLDATFHCQKSKEQHKNVLRLNFPLKIAKSLQIVVDDAPPLRCEDRETVVELLEAMEILDKGLRNGRINAFDSTSRRKLKQLAVAWDKRKSTRSVQQPTVSPTDESSPQMDCQTETVMNALSLSPPQASGDIRHLLREQCIECNTQDNTTILIRRLPITKEEFEHPGIDPVFKIDETSNWKVDVTAKEASEFCRQLTLRSCPGLRCRLPTKSELLIARGRLDSLFVGNEKLWEWCLDPDSISEYSIFGADGSKIGTSLLSHRRLGFRCVFIAK